ncbi:DUF4262 domain-containing protein [Lysobacter sp. A6]|uniref:DUF4262 domain-containing protein n=1 Tax=Noviluteimonas lactosilytica TaxID=2888523 RepID=A0ABS8JI39_9GAMM|nr:DUF4262 domain-containing protein [Lysobacter lactosilyticus]MCC8363235.1 DUF4262 domain-containing protein [Lysobacter lactosilyticus]
MTELRLPPKNDYERKLLRNVDQFGWQCTSVYEPEDSDSEEPPFSYSVGLHQSYQQPEFIIFGLDAKVAHAIIATCANKFADGSGIDLDQPSYDLIEDLPCVFVRVPRDRYNEYVYSALWFYAEKEFPLYQIVWPDADGLFPWHADASAGFRQWQPVLGQVGAT